MEGQEKLLEIHHLHKDYGNGAVLKDVSLDIHKGEVLVLIGPSGCGKSTFLRCMNGLEQIQSGEIRLDKEVITDPKTKWSEVRQKIGMVFQSYELFPGAAGQKGRISPPAVRRPETESGNREGSDHEAGDSAV